MHDSSGAVYSEGDKKTAPPIKEGPSFSRGIVIRRYCSVAWVGGEAGSGAGSVSTRPCSPGVGSREPAVNQRQRANYDVPFNGVQILPTVNTSTDTLGVFYGPIRPIPESEMKKKDHKADWAEWDRWDYCSTSWQTKSQSLVRMRSLFNPSGSKALAAPFIALLSITGLWKRSP